MTHLECVLSFPLRGVCRSSLSAPNILWVPAKFRPPILSTQNPNTTASQARSTKEQRSAKSNGFASFLRKLTGRSGSKSKPDAKAVVAPTTSPINEKPASAIPAADTGVIVEKVVSNAGETKAVVAPVPVSPSTDVAAETVHEKDDVAEQVESVSAHESTESHSAAKTELDADGPGAAAAVDQNGALVTEAIPEEPVENAYDAVVDTDDTAPAAAQDTDEVKEGAADAVEPTNVAEVAPLGAPVIADKESVQSPEAEATTGGPVADVEKEVAEVAGPDTASETVVSTEGMEVKEAVTEAEAEEVVKRVEVEAPTTAVEEVAPAASSVVDEAVSKLEPLETAPQIEHNPLVLGAPVEVSSAEPSSETSPRDEASPEETTATPGTEKAVEVEEQAGAEATVASVAPSTSTARGAEVDAAVSAPQPSEPAAAETSTERESGLGTVDPVEPATDIDSEVTAESSAEAEKPVEAATPLQAVEAAKTADSPIATSSPVVEPVPEEEKFTTPSEEIVNPFDDHAASETAAATSPAKVIKEASAPVNKTPVDKSQSVSPVRVSKEVSVPAVVDLSEEHDSPDFSAAPAPAPAPAPSADASAAAAVQAAQSASSRGLHTSLPRLEMHSLAGFEIEEGNEQVRDFTPAPHSAATATSQTDSLVSTSSARATSPLASTRTVPRQNSSTSSLGGELKKGGKWRRSMMGLSDVSPSFPRKTVYEEGLTTGTWWEIDLAQVVKQDIALIGHTGGDRRTASSISAITCGLDPNVLSARFEPTILANGKEGIPHERGSCQLPANAAHEQHYRGRDEGDEGSGGFRELLPCLIISIICSSEDYLSNLYSTCSYIYV